MEKQSGFLLLLPCSFSECPGEAFRKLRGQSEFSWCWFAFNLTWRTHDYSDTRKRQRVQLGQFLQRQTPWRQQLSKKTQQNRFFSGVSTWIFLWTYWINKSFHLMRRSKKIYPLLRYVASSAILGTMQCPVIHILLAGKANRCHCETKIWHQLCPACFETA